jgi:hypothetical protein
VRRLIIVPGKGGVYDPALGHADGVVPLVEGEVLLFGAKPVTEVGIFPVQGPDGRLGVRIEQELVGVESVAVFRLVRPMDPVAVELAEPAVGQVAVPDPIRSLPQLDPLDLRFT